MTMRALCEQFHRWRDEAEAMVLATVIDTAGSTYSKAGAQMLIAPDQGHRGLLSGGCLEGDLTLHAQRCLTEGRPRVVSYDMRNREEDEIWGLGLGCDGALDILLQPLTDEEAWQPFAAIADAARSGRRAAWGLVVGPAPGHEEAPHPLLGSSVVLTDPTNASQTRRVRGALDETGLETITERCRDVALAGGVERLALADGQGTSLDVLVTPVNTPIRLLVVGAGPDTLPLLRMSRELGWYVTQADHRPGSLAAAKDGAPVDVSVEVIPGRLREHLALDRFDAVVIMSHHLVSDRAYLEELALSEVPFIGLLGPAARRRRLLADVTERLANGGDRVTGLRDARALTARTHGPVGLDLGARDPAGIALSIVAQVQQFHARNG
ncbi:MAG: XdhC/CoxI family protein [Pseudomonadota bacterium]